MAKLLPSATEYLVKHLVEIEEGKKKLLEEYFPDQSSERFEIEMLIDHYIKHIEQLMHSKRVLKADNSEIPFVTIGSEVEIKDLSNQDVYMYRIVNPYSTSVRDGGISF